MRERVICYLQQNRAFTCLTIPAGLITISLL